MSTILIQLFKLIITNKAVLSFVFSFIIDMLAKQTKRTDTNIDDIIINKIRQDAKYLGYIKT